MAIIKRGIWTNSATVPVIEGLAPLIQLRLFDLGNLYNNNLAYIEFGGTAEKFNFFFNKTNGITFNPTKIRLFLRRTANTVAFVQDADTLGIQLFVDGIGTNFTNNDIANAMVTAWNGLTQIQVFTGTGTVDEKNNIWQPVSSLANIAPFGTARVMNFINLNAYSGTPFVQSDFTSSGLAMGFVSYDGNATQALPGPNYETGSWDVNTQTLTSPFGNHIWSQSLPNSTFNSDGSISNLNDLYELYTVFDDAEDHSILTWYGPVYLAGEKLTSVFLDEIKRFAGGIKSITSNITTDANDQKSVTLTITNLDDSIISNTFQLAADVTNVTTTESIDSDGQRSILLKIIKSDGTEVDNTFNLAAEITNIESEEITDATSGQKSIKLKVTKADNTELETDFNLNTNLVNITTSQTINQIGQVLVRLGFNESDGTTKTTSFTVPIPSVNAENIEFTEEPVNVSVTPPENVVVDIQNITQNIDVTSPNTVVEFKSNNVTDVDLTVTKSDVELTIPQVNVEFAALGVPGNPGIGFIQIYTRSATFPDTPTGGSFDFRDNVFTPPTGWSRSVPNGSEQTYGSISLLQLGTTLSWSTPFTGADTNINLVSGEFLSNEQLQLNFSNGTSIDIDLSDLTTKTELDAVEATLEDDINTEKARITKEITDRTTAITNVTSTANLDRSINLTARNTISTRLRDSIDGVSYNSLTKELIFTRTATGRASIFVGIPSGGVSSLTFSNSTNILNLKPTDSGSLTVNLSSLNQKADLDSEIATRISQDAAIQTDVNETFDAASFNTTTRNLTLTRVDNNNDVSINIPVGEVDIDSLIKSITFNTTTQVLTLTKDDDSTSTVDISSLNNTAAITSAIATEVSARNAAIATETSARTSADTALGTRINPTFQSASFDTTTRKLTLVPTNSGTNSTILTIPTGNTDTFINDVELAVNTLVLRYNDTSITPLQIDLSHFNNSGAIANEAGLRAAADTTLQANITAEATARASADTTLQANITTEGTKIGNEVTARKAADVVITTKLNETFDSASFNNTTRLLTLTRVDDANPISLNIPEGDTDTNTFASGLSYSLSNNELTLTLNNGTNIGVNLSELNYRTDLEIEKTERISGDDAIINRLNFFIPNNNYEKGQLIIEDRIAYTAKEAFTSGATFDINDWDRLKRIAGSELVSGGQTGSVSIVLKINSGLLEGYSAIFSKPDGSPTLSAQLLNNGSFVPTNTSKSIFDSTTVTATTLRLTAGSTNSTNFPFESLTNVTSSDGTVGTISTNTVDITLTSFTLATSYSGTGTVKIQGKDASILTASRSASISRFTPFFYGTRSTAPTTFEQLETMTNSSGWSNSQNLTTTSSGDFYIAIPNATISSAELNGNFVYEFNTPTTLTKDDINGNTITYNIYVITDALDNTVINRFQ